MYQYYNPNPRRSTCDDAVRAVAKLMGVDWDTAYFHLAIQGYAMKEMPSSLSVVGTFLRQNGYARKMPDEGYSVEEACLGFPQGKLMAITEEGKCIPIIDGTHYYTANVSDSFILQYWEKG